MVKRKIIAALLCALFVFSLTACKNAQEPPQPSPSPTDSTGQPQQSATLEAIYALHPPETVMLTVGGNDVTWETFFYFVQYSVYQLVGSPDYVGSWGEAFPYSEEETIQQAVLDNAVSILLQNKAVEYGAGLMNLELTEKDKEDIQGEWQGLVTTYGEEELLNTLKEQFCTKELYFWILETSRLLEKCLTEMFGMHGEKLSEEDIAEFAGTEDYLMAKHILIKTLKTDGETGQDVPMTDEEKAAAREKAEDILAEIEAFSGGDFGAFFDGLVKKHSEDPGSIARPEGYLFTKGNMVKEFENATRELEIGEHSGIVESQFGYHIIYRVPIDSGAVPIAYSSYGGEYTLRTLTAYSMFQSVMEGWQEQIEVTYSDAYNALNFDDAE
jgi:hypothetical protein